MVHVRLDERVKAKAEKALAAMGLSVSDRVPGLLTRVAAEKALPFEVRVPNATTRAAIQGARRGGLRSFTSVNDLMADLNAPRSSARTTGPGPGRGQRSRSRRRVPGPALPSGSKRDSASPA